MKLHVALVALLALPALGAGQLEALRANATAMRAQVAALRAAQLDQRNQLSQLSSRIETLKASQKGRLLPGGELDAALKESQELSQSLTDLAQRLSGRESELEGAQLALLDSLSAEWTRLRSDFDRQSNRSVRQGLIEQMKKLRQEREAIRASLPAAKLPTLDALKPSDDPEELLEQANLLRDDEEKLRKELQTLEHRISERQQEAELDRRVQRFLGEESMFDDQDRRLRLQKTTSLQAAAPASNGAGDQAPNTASPGVTAGSFNDPGSKTLNSPAFGSLDNSDVSISRATDARPQVGVQPPIAPGEDDDLGDLVARRAKLKGLADELRNRASTLEKRATQLK